MSGRRATGAAVRRLVETLSDRDKAILADVARVRVLTGGQVDRLHFAELTGAHRDRTRRRVLERLVSVGLLATLERRIGGVRAGSAGLVFTLGLAGQRILKLEAIKRTRQPGAPTNRFLAHNLAIAELYVSLREAERAQWLTLNSFHAEPACWWRDSEGEWIKPDAYAVVSCGDVEDSWAIEVDQATESLPTLRRKLMVYLNLVANEERGPRGGLLPRVLLSVVDQRRLTAVRELVRSLPEPAEQLLLLTVHNRAVEDIALVLRE